MKRRLFILLAAMSLVLLLATCALSVRSYCVADQVIFSHGNGKWQSLNSESGNFIVSWGVLGDIVYPQDAERWHYSKGSNPSTPRSEVTLADLQSHLHFLGLAWNAFGSRHDPNSVRLAIADMDIGTVVDIGWERRLTIPYWFAALLTAILPLVLLRSRRRPGHQIGHCDICGYDLRATPDRCPECGSEGQIHRKWANAHWSSYD